MADQDKIKQDQPEVKSQSVPQRDVLRCPYCTATVFTRYEVGGIVNGAFVVDHEEYQCAGICGARGPLRDFLRNKGE